MGRMTASASLVALFTFLLLLPVGSAAAQQAPDVVETHDGGMVRGTIVERRPDGSIVLVDAVGQVREFPAASVRYAGVRVEAPADRHDPRATPPTPAREATEPRSVEVHFTSDPTRLSLEVVTGRAHVRYQGRQGTIVEMGTVCEAPCVGLLPAGPQTLAVRAPNGGRYVLRNLRLHLDHPVSLHVRLVSKSRGLRLGLGLGGLGLAAVGLAVVVPNLDRGGTTRGLVTGLFLAGVGLSVSFVGVGLRRPRTDYSVVDYPAAPAP